MKTKLKKFDEFVQSLFPHEIDYLLSVQQFQSTENNQILSIIADNIHQRKVWQKFDDEIDKRRYSNLKKWMEEKLSSIDVDLFLNWLLNLDEKIITDRISQQEELFIIQKLKQVQSNDYYFIRFYEMIEHYRDYLLIRVRKRYYQPVFQFLSENYLKYSQAIEINKQLNLATKDIVQHKKITENELIQWQQFLYETLQNDKLNGDSRYKALIRLSLYYYKKQDFSQLTSLYLSMDKEFAGSNFYSKRILANYYANRSLVLAKTGNLADAETFACLSIKIKNNDYLFYINNLLYILHQQKKYSQALKIAAEAIPNLKHTNSFYNRIGFTALYIRTLNNTKQSERAVSYAQSFFEAYKKEIFDYRWHLFFTAFFESLLLQEKYNTILSYCKRYQLVKLERKEQNLKSQNNILYWFSIFSEYMIGELSETKLKKAFEELKTNKEISKNNKYQVEKLFKELKTYFPDFIIIFNKNVPQEEFIF
jgi:hypothetical protein